MSKRVFIQVLYSPGKYHFSFFFQWGPFLCFLVMLLFLLLLSPPVRQMRGYVLMSKGREKMWGRLPEGCRTGRCMQECTKVLYFTTPPTPRALVNPWQWEGGCQCSEKAIQGQRCEVRGAVSRHGGTKEQEEQAHGRQFILHTNQAMFNSKHT